MRVSRILHAGYIFESAGVRIAFDPILETPFSTNCFAFPAVEFDLASASSSGALNFDAVFISHFHDDHCSLVSLARLPRTVPIYLYCEHDELFEMIRSLGFHVENLRVDKPIHVIVFTVTPRLALDPEVDCVFEIEAEGLTVLNVVDAWLDPSVLTLRKSWDLVLWPFQTMRELEVLTPELGAPRVYSWDEFRSSAGAMNDGSPSIESVRKLPPEWVEQLQTLNARHVVPSSCQIKFEDWSWYNRAFFPISYAQFARDIPCSQRIEPGETFELTKTSFERVGGLNWIKSISNSNGESMNDGISDYDYIDFDGSTPERTPPPTSEIAKRFPALTKEQRQQVDRFCEGLDVTLYDHEGNAKGSGTTEAIAYKVYRAMTEGEQITSMYLRTEDIDNDELIAKLSHDPLSFQRAELRRLTALKFFY